MTLLSRLRWLLGRWSRQLRRRSIGENVVYSRAERVFILERQFATKSFFAVREAFSNVYSDKGVQNNSTPTGNISGHGNCSSMTSAHQAIE
jgi:hypothetical protein